MPRERPKKMAKRQKKKIQIKAKAKYQIEGDETKRGKEGKSVQDGRGVGGGYYLLPKIYNKNLCVDQFSQYIH